MLAVASKQTMAPSAVALPCFVLMTDGRRAFTRYIAVQIAASASIFAAMLAFFRPTRDLLFNTFTLAANQPPRTGSVVFRMMGGLAQIQSDLAVVVAPLLLLIAIIALGSGGIRQRMAKHGWLVFLWMAAFQLPIELRAWSTVGGWLNHLGIVTLFVLLATTLGLVEFWKPAANTTQEWTGVAARALLIGMLLARFPVPYSIFGDLRLVRTSATQVAYNYERQHPGRAYFPFNPLASLLAEGKLTHFDPALLDREIAGYRISAEQLAAGLPAGCELVAFPPRHEPSAAILRELLQDKPLVEEPGLEGWRVYRLGLHFTQLTSSSLP
jgi:hypothetical protein